MYLSAEIAQARVADLLRQAEHARRARTARTLRAEAPKRPLVTRTVVLPVEPAAAPQPQFVEPQTDRGAREAAQVGG